MRADDRPSPPTVDTGSDTDATELLRQHGCRATKPRVAVLRAVLDAGRPVAAVELAELATRRLEGIHEATVYRNIALLSELGIVSHVHAGHGPSLVKLASDDSVLTACRHCGRIGRAPKDAVAGFAEGLEADSGFRLELGHHALEGICADCAQPVT